MDSRKNLPIEAIMTAFEASYDGLHILDCQGNTLYINNACTRIEGISREEAMQKNIRQLLEEGTYSESVTLKVLETQEATTIIQTAKNGNQLLTTGTPVFGKDGKIDKIVVNSRDITDLNDLKKELSAKKTELEHLRLEQGKFGAVIAKSTAMQKVLRLALTVAKVDSSVLITGESGVGKGMLAEFIHKNSWPLTCMPPFYSILGQETSGNWKILLSGWWSAPLATRSSCGTCLRICCLLPAMINLPLTWIRKAIKKSWPDTILLS